MNTKKEKIPGNQQQTHALLELLCLRTSPRTVTWIGNISVQYATTAPDRVHCVPAAKLQATSSSSNPFPESAGVITELLC